MRSTLSISRATLNDNFAKRSDEVETCGSWAHVIRLASARQGIYYSFATGAAEYEGATGGALQTSPPDLCSSSTILSAVN